MFVKRFFRWLAAPVAASAMISACGQADVVNAASAVDPDDCDLTTADGRPVCSNDASEKADQWNYTNNPSRFGVPLEYTLAKLPKEGKASKTPWPDTYWPVYEDSYNARWQRSSFATGDVVNDELSPAEKYDVAFNGWKIPEGFLKLKPYSSSNCEGKSWDKTYYEKLGPAATYVAKEKGNWDAHDGVDNDNDGKTDECDDRDGVETWWGLCHAWVPAAILEEEPIHPVTYNGVKFEVSDIKALIIGMYDRTEAMMIGGRCNEKEVLRDEKTGEIKNIECKDTNAGSYHVIMSNFLGTMKRAIAEDRTSNYEVWNQPIIEWKNHELKEITEAEALKLLNRPTVKKYTEINPLAVKLFYAESSTFYITESHASKVPYVNTIQDYTREDRYKYIIEVDKDGKINGGEWVLDASDKKPNVPDFLWLPIKGRGGNPEMDFAKVKMLLDLSRKEPTAAVDTKTYDFKTATKIPDYKKTGVSTKIRVDDKFKTQKVEVEVNISHAYIGDLRVALVKGTAEYVLHDRTGGAKKEIKETYTVDRAIGVDADGDWTLVVADHKKKNVGTLNSWKLKLGKSGTDTPVAPGTVKASATPGSAIPDNDPNGVTSKIDVADAKNIKSVRITVKISHSYVGALSVDLQHAGVTASLSHNEGGAETTIEKTFTVDAFNGASTAGAWELTVRDTDAYGDTGKIESWSIEATY